MGLRLLHHKRGAGQGHAHGLAIAVPHGPHGELDGSQVHVLNGLEQGLTRKAPLQPGPPLGFLPHPGRKGTLTRRVFQQPVAGFVLDQHIPVRVHQAQGLARLAPHELHPVGLLGLRLDRFHILRLDIPRPRIRGFRLPVQPVLLAEQDLGLRRLLGFRNFHNPLALLFHFRFGDSHRSLAANHPIGQHG